MRWQCELIMSKFTREIAGVSGIQWNCYSAACLNQSWCDTIAKAICATTLDSTKKVMHMRELCVNNAQFFCKKVQF
jgi:hypothetical protein